MRELARLRVMVVEDEGLVGLAVAQQLRLAGHEVVGMVSDGLSALALVPEIDPDVVVMDIDIPAPDGIEVARLLSETSPVPVVLLTAHQNTELLARAAAAGVGAYLLKPPDARELARALAVSVARFDDLMAQRALTTALEAEIAQRSEDLATAKLLDGIIPICMYCKRIRDDEDQWQRIEQYIAAHSRARFSHGICPECFEAWDAEQARLP